MSFSKRRTNNKGSAFVQAMLAVAVMGVMIYFLSPTIIKHRQQVTKTASIITARLALHSMVDYTLFGIRQRWCFSESWLSEPCGTSTPSRAVEVLSHPRSVERLLMKAQNVDFLRALDIPSPERAPLQRVVQLINISSFSAMHPVYRIVADLRGYTVEYIKVEISRDNRGAIPEYGREVYLKVNVQLLDSARQVINVGSSRLEATSFVGVYPREVGSFGLVVAGDLHLDRESGADLGAGGAYLKQHGSRFAMLRYPGLVFESPVFVNGAIHLPLVSEGDSAEDSDTVYTPVTFKDKVVLGAGPVKRRGVDFRPRTAGGPADQFWYNIRQFGGFQKGVEVDGERDLGLDYLSGAASGGVTPSATLMAQCRELEKARFELAATADSKLSGQLLSSGAGNYKFRIGLSEGNMFTPQSKEVDNPRTDGWSRDLRRWDREGPDRGPIGKFRFSMGGLIVTGELADGGRVTLEPRIDLRPLERSIERQVSDLERDLTVAESRTNSAARDLESAERRVRDASDALEAAESRSPRDEAQVSRANDDLREARLNRDRAQERLTEAEETQAGIERGLEAAREQLRVVRSKMEIQPKVHISLTSPRRSADEEERDNTNASFKDLEVSFENENMFVNSMGERLPVSVRFEAYDVSYFRGFSWRSFTSHNTKGHLTFEPEGDSSFGASPTILDERGVSRGGLPAGDPYLNMAVSCDTLRSQAAFQGTDWSSSFASNARHSWSFTNKYEERTNVIFSGTDSYNPPGGGGSTVSFRVVSVARDCIIEAGAKFVSGFFTCERLIIRPRSTPLRIIGSFIVTNGLLIDDSAYRAGIRWSTIYNPMATFELRQAGVLRGQSLGPGLPGQDCRTINRFPVWHPYPSMKDVSNLYKCNSISLRAKADPFRWTSVDPDCGLLATGNSTVCKNRLVRFFVLEVSRESGI